MMLSNAFQSRTMESMRSRNLGKLSRVELPSWSWSDCATILQESVLARSGGGIAIHPSFCPFSLFCLFDTCTTTQPSRPRGCRPARRGRDAPDPAELVLG